MGILDQILNALHFRNADEIHPPSIPSPPLNTATTQSPIVQSSRSAYILCNPRAGRGSVANEASTLESRLRALGFNSIYEETRRTAAERALQIQAAISILLQRNSPIELFLIGGDGTVVPAFQTAFETALGHSLSEVQMTPEANAQIWRQFSGITIFAVGTAADLARQNGAPPSYLFLAHQFLHRSLPNITPLPRPFQSLERYMEESVLVPWTIPLHSFNDGPYQASTEAAGVGLDGLMFLNVEDIRRRTGNINLNMYFRELKNILNERLKQNWSFDVEVFVNGESRGIIKNNGTILTTPNSFLAGVGGIPGPWGSVKVFLIPANRQGLAILFEAVRRGVLTRIGIDQISTANALNSLGADRQFLFEPGDRAEFRVVKVSNGPEEVEAEINGDGLRNIQEEPELVKTFKVFVPPLFAPSRAHPGSVAARLHSLAALRRGDFLPRKTSGISETVIVSFSKDNSVYRVAEIPKPIAAQRRLNASEILTASPEYRESLTHLPIGRMLRNAPLLQNSATQSQSASTFYPTEDLHRLAEEHQIQAAEVPRIIEAAHNGNLNSAQSMEQVDAWCRNENNVEQLNALRKNFADTRVNRLRSQGGSLVFGLLTLLGVNHLLNSVGIDAEHDPLAHFSLSTLTAHLIHKTAQALQSPLIQLLRKQAFEHRALQSIASDGLSISRTVLTGSSTFSSAVKYALREAFGFGVSHPQSAAAWMRYGAGAAAGTLVNVIGGMGAGLLASRASEFLLDHLTTFNANEKSVLSSLAFFLPNALQIAFGNTALWFFRNRAFMTASLGMALGFSADLIFNSAMHWIHGNNFERVRQDYHDFARIHDQHSSCFLRNLSLGAISVFTPEAGCYLRSIF